MAVYRLEFNDLGEPCFIEETPVMSFAEEQEALEDSVSLEPEAEEIPIQS